jgi:hypothetical protein
MTVLARVSSKLQDRQFFGEANSRPESIFPILYTTVGSLPCSTQPVITIALPDVS